MISCMFFALMLTALAGFSTLLGSLIIFLIKKPKDSYLSAAMGFAAGVMTFVALTELLNESIEGLGYSGAILSFFAGVILIFLLDALVPHIYKAEEACDNPQLNKKQRLKKCGLLVALGIAIHNFPEGIAVFFSSLADQRLGITMAIAIALHNIPEGIAVAMPIYYATKSKTKAFYYSFLSGVTEPLAGLISFLILQNFLNDTILNVVIGAAAGIMVFISFDELLPFAYQQKHDNLTLAGVFAGMGVMALSLFLI